MNRSSVLLFLLLFLPVILFAQDKQKLDSLMKELPTAEDTQRVKVLREISYYNRHDNPALAMDYADQALKLAQDLGWETGIISAYMQKGLVYYNISRHDSAIKYFQLGLDRALPREIPAELAALYSNMGNAYGDIGQNKKCLDCYLKSDHWTKLSNQPFKSVYMKVNIGTIYSVMEQHDSALVFYEEALRTMLDLDSTDEKLYIVYGNLGATYMELGDTVKAEKAFRRSHYFSVKYDNTRALSSSYDHLAIIEHWKGNTDTALAYFRKAIEIAYLIEAGSAISESCYHLGNLFNELGMYDSALYYLNRGVKIAEEIQDIYTMDNYYEEISRSYEKTGKLDSALFYYKKMQATRDTMFNMNKSNIVNEMRVEIENERNQRELDMEKAKSEKKDLMLFAAIVLGTLILILAAVAFNRYLVKKRSAQLLEKQKEEIQEQKEIIEEKNKDITDSIVYSKRIQNAILPSDEKMRELFPQSWCCFIPKDIVSGDFFWFEQEGEYKLFGVIDCTGHGVPGALLSVVGHSILGKALSDHKLVMPNKILGFLDEEIHRVLRHRNETEVNSVQDGMDVALCCYHEKSQTIHYSGAFNAMYIIRKGAIIEYKADKLMIGAGESRYRPYQLHSVKIEKGDEIVLFSDGYADQFGGPFGKKMKYKPFKELLISVSDKSMQEQHEFIQRSFAEWRKNFDQVDDVCVVAVKL
jgi:serine phosphatase RsbU (regulator of sigma subunit)